MPLLYDFTLSGHCHRVRLLFSLIGERYRRQAVDLAAGQQRGLPFRSMNPFGTVPVLEDGGHIIRDSNAILIYLATKHDREDWLPSDALGRARVEEWLAVSARDLVDGPARARAATLWDRPFDIPACQAVATKLFEIMDAHLSVRDWLAVEHPTIADLANYSYTRAAPEGGIDLAAFPNLVRWLERVEALPGFVAMPAAK